MNRDWLEKDFYELLGVDEKASQDEIRRAYRKLAQKLHPDANPGDTTAEERFKQVSEAHAVLSNPERRKEYDEVRRLGASGFGGGNPFGGNPFGGGGYQQNVRVEDISDLFGGLGDLFGGQGGGGGGRRRSGPRRGADTQTKLTLSFADAFQGVTTTVSVRGEAACSRCHGTGGEPGTNVSTCPTCRGAGQVAQNQGLFAFPATCPQCHGSGRLIESPCSNCGGAGTEVRTRNIKVKIPAGVRDGATIRVPGKGQPGMGGGPAGDLIVAVAVDKHQVFGRKGNDLTVTVPITYTEATLGTEIEVPTMTKTVKLRIPAGTASGRTFRVRGKGVNPERGKAGDLLVKVEVVVPSKLSKDEKKLLQQLATYETENVRAHLT